MLLFRCNFFWQFSQTANRDRWKTTTTCMISLNPAWPKNTAPSSGLFGKNLRLSDLLRCFWALFERLLSLCIQDADPSVRWGHWAARTGWKGERQSVLCSEQVTHLWKRFEWMNERCALSHRETRRSIASKYLRPSLSSRKVKLLLVHPSGRFVPALPPGV